MVQNIAKIITKLNSLHGKFTTQNGLKLMRPAEFQAPFGEHRTPYQYASLRTNLQLQSKLGAAADVQRLGGDRVGLCDPHKSFPPRAQRPVRVRQRKGAVILPPPPRSLVLREALQTF